jgi:nitrate/nitrite transporter NarK
MTLSDYGTSIVRTVVPFIVGTALTVAAKWGFDIDAEAVTPIATIVVGAVYYATVRKIEESRPEVGKLLGKAVQPVYGDK